MRGLPIRDGERSVLVKCYAGSDPHEVVAASARSALARHPRSASREAMITTRR